VSELIVITKAQNTGQKAGQLQPFDEEIRATAIPSDRALELSCTMVCILGFCIHQTYSLKLSLLADWNV